MAEDKEVVEGEEEEEKQNQCKAVDHLSEDRQHYRALKDPLPWP